MDASLGTTRDGLLELLADRSWLSMVRRRGELLWLCAWFMRRLCVASIRRFSSGSSGMANDVDVDVGT